MHSLLDSVTKKLIGLLCAVCLLGGTTGCGSLVPASTEQVEKIDLRKFVPQNGAAVVTRNNGYKTDKYEDITRRYSVVSNNEISTTYNVRQSIVFSIEASRPIVDNFSWEVTKNTITTQGPFGKSVRVNLPKWSDGQEKSVLTEIGKTVETKVGTFTDCIEITSEVLERKWYYLWLTGEKTVTKAYWAPNFGEVKTYFKHGDMDFFLMSEIVAYQGPLVSPASSLSKSKIQTHSSVRASDMALVGITVGQSSISDAKNALGEFPTVINLVQNGPNGRDSWGKLYKNASVEAITGNDTSSDRVIYFSVKDNTFPTSRGIKVGDNIQKVMTVYGEPTNINKNQNEIWYFAEGVPEASRKIWRYTYLSQESGKYGRLVFNVDPVSNTILSIAASVLPFGL